MRQLGVVLAVKIAFILVIKEVWFSHPAAEGMQMPVASVTQHILGPATTNNAEQ